MNKPALFSVVFPIVTLGGWLGQLGWSEHNGTEVLLPVTGFDPRDLLAGHYLTYTVDYGPIEVCPREGLEHNEETCVCLVEASNQTHQNNWVGSCSERPQTCDVFIKGECRFGRFEAQIERFYFPESYTSELVVVPAKSAIKVVVQPSGAALVTGFTVDGVDLLDYARAQSNEL